ncbi:MAG: hypothetical protein Q8M06_08125 [Methanobacteriaceae archaeon]|nr:hypothetical protein [Methanobacteriaceae archaeon]MDZ4171587.1 hypothetical protein [Methanobacteriaceae archaeon]
MMKEYVSRKEFYNLELELELMELELLKSLKNPSLYIDDLSKTYNLITNRSFGGFYESL